MEAQRSSGQAPRPTAPGIGAGAPQPTTSRSPPPPRRQRRPETSGSRAGAAGIDSGLASAAAREQPLRATPADRRGAHNETILGHVDDARDRRARERPAGARAGYGRSALHPRRAPERVRVGLLRALHVP